MSRKAKLSSVIAEHAAAAANTISSSTHTILGSILEQIVEPKTPSSSHKSMTVSLNTKQESSALTATPTHSLSVSHAVKQSSSEAPEFNRIVLSARVKNSGMEFAEHPVLALVT